MGSTLTSSYLEHLPAILRQGPFMGRFLLAFESVLSGGVPAPTPETPTVEGLETTLDHVQTFFDPLGDPAGGPLARSAPDDFLPWLAQWVATSLRDDWDSATKRAFISGIVPLYRARGTRVGMERVLRLYAPETEVVEVHDDAIPHYFQVILTVPENDPAALAKKGRLTRAIVDREKPAHTFYSLRLRYPAMQINEDPEATPFFGPGVIVGVNTVVITENVNRLSLFLAIQINDDPAVTPEYGPGVIVGVNTLVGTEQHAAGGAAHTIHVGGADSGDGPAVGVNTVLDDFNP